MVRTTIPARMDRLRCTTFHTGMVTGVADPAERVRSRRRVATGVPDGSGTGIGADRGRSHPAEGKSVEDITEPLAAVDPSGRDSHTGRKES